MIQKSSYVVYGKVTYQCFKGILNSYKLDLNTTLYFWVTAVSYVKWLDYHFIVLSHIVTFEE